jgi:hypothetical protein
MRSLSLSCESVFIRAPFHNRCKPGLNQGTAAIIGEPSGGWFWLPPWSLWQQWATQGFNNAARAMDMKGQPLEKSPDR